MEFSLLATKLRVPPPTRQEVSRARLVEEIEREIPDRGLVVVSAAAGYGKTTLLAQWARASRFPVGWLTLDPEDNDLDRFFRYLVTTWDSARPGILESPLGVLLGTMAPDRDAVLTAFVNVANGLAEPTVLVLDDYHLIDDAAIHGALTFLLDHLPPALRFVLAGRSEPPLPLARYRARGQVLEIRTEDLRFGTAETAAFLRRTGRGDLGEAEAAALGDHLEGWAAGLQLVSLTRRGKHEPGEALAVSGRHRFVADYLTQEVLAGLPAERRKFLLRTSILDRFCAAVCDAVTGRDDGQATLETLERENLFVVPLDDRREWFRYHRIFADLLRDELRRHEPAAVAELHRRAARWFLAGDLAEEAFRHAVAGEDPVLTTEIGETYSSRKLFSGEVNVVSRWLEAIPGDWYASYPPIGLTRATYLLVMGDFPGSTRCLETIEGWLAGASGPDVRRNAAKLQAMRCFLSCFRNDLARAEAHAERALRELPAEEVSYRTDIYQALGDTYRGNGRWEEARASYLRVLDLPPDRAFPIRAVHVYGALADLEVRRGRLRDAAGWWRRALAGIEEREAWGRLPLPVIGWVSVRLGEILYEWNDLDGARDHLARGLERAELGGDVRTLIAGHLIAGRVKLAAGDVAAAADDLERVRSLLAQSPFPDWTGRRDRFQIELWLAQNRLRAAIDWVEATARDSGREDRPDEEDVRLALARVAIVRGDRPGRERALALLTGLIESADADGRMGIQIEALALRAVALWQSGDRPGALTALEQALRLAEPEGYVRLFADLGPPMARLLQEARSRRVMPDYVAALLAACAADPAAAGDALPEPLSAREQEVVRLIAAGLTNREIAAALSISPETIKKHTAAIYGKLGAGNRTEAAARARALDLLD